MSSRNATANRPTTPGPNPSNGLPNTSKSLRRYALRDACYIVRVTLCALDVLRGRDARVRACAYVGAGVCRKCNVKRAKYVACGVCSHA